MEEDQVVPNGKAEKKVEKEIEQGKEGESSTKTSPEKKRTALPSLVPSFNKTYSRTWFQSSIFEFDWTIDRFATLYRVMTKLVSISFPKTGSFQIQMTVSHNNSVWWKNKIRFHLLTKLHFLGEFKVYVIRLEDSYKALCKSCSGSISNETLLYETTVESVCSFCDSRGALTLHFEFEIFNKLLDDTVHMDILSLTPVFSKNLKSINSIQDNTSEPNDKKLITFIINGEHYSVPQNLLCASSNFFKNLCSEKNENVMNKLTINVMPDAFKEMLSFIMSGLITDPLDYKKLQDLLIISDKYDVQNLKLICEQYLLRSITHQNAIQFIKLAFLCNAKHLEKHTASFIKFHIKKIVRTTEFQILSQKDLEKLLELIEKVEIHKRYSKFQD